MAKTPQIIISHAWGVILHAELLHPSPQVQVTQHPGLITSLLLCAQPPNGDSLCEGLCTPPHSEALAAHKPKGVRVRQGIRRRLFHAYGATTVCLTRSSAAPALVIISIIASTDCHFVPCSLPSLASLPLLLEPPSARRPPWPPVFSARSSPGSGSASLAAAVFAVVPGRRGGQTMSLPLQQ